MRKKHFLIKPSSIFALLSISTLVIPSFTFARTIHQTATNSNTQSGSYNDSTNTIVEEIEVKNENEATVTNCITQTTNTGGNTVKDVNGDVTVTTGDASVSSSIENNLNTNETTVEGGSADVTLETENSVTQSDSENYAYATYENEVEVENENELEVKNYVSQTADTGSNYVKEVNGDVELETGDADLESEIVTEGNTNETTVDGGSDVELTATNNTTQSDSYNDANAEAKQKVEIENENETKAFNSTVQEGYSGYNTVKDVNGDVDAGSSTGDVSFSSSTKTDVNNNTTEVGPNLGDITVTTENKYTQSDSENYAYGEVKVKLELENENELFIANFNYMYGDSGTNYIKEVNGDVDLSTGDVDGSFEVENLGNVNKNEIDGFGDFEAIAKNEYTQSDSYNDADSSIKVKLELENENEACVFNKAEVFGYTGYNKVKEINGDVDMNTGDVEFDNTTENDLNHSTTKLAHGYGDVEQETLNSNTQSDSENYAYATVDLETEVENENDLHLNNHYESEGDTGFNKTKEVNGDVMYDGGLVDESFEIVNDANTIASNL